MIAVVNYNDYRLPIMKKAINDKITWIWHKTVLHCRSYFDRGTQRQWRMVIKANVTYGLCITVTCLSVFRCVHRQITIQGPDGCTPLLSDYSKVNQVKSIWTAHESHAGCQCMDVTNQSMFSVKRKGISPKTTTNNTLAGGNTAY